MVRMFHSRYLILTCWNVQENRRKAELKLVQKFDKVGNITFLTVFKHLILVVLDGNQSQKRMLVFDIIEMDEGLSVHQQR